MPRSAPRRFAVKDLAEIALGACVMAFPVAVTEEVWNLGAELSTTRALLFALASIFFLAILILLLHHQELEGTSLSDFFKRTISTYIVTLLISAALLYGVDRFDLLGDPMVALKRAILVAFPASFAATVVDGLRLAQPLN